MQPLAIFRSGKHTAMNGAEIHFTEQDVQSIANAYDPGVHEAPLVIGHPQTNAPAYGWVKALSFSDGLLKAIPRAVSDEFAQWVNAGFYKKISASFYAPNHSSNPVPSGYYLRHVGFLGATPPAVKGMPDPSFTDLDHVLLIEFGESARLAHEPNETTQILHYREKLHQQGLYCSYEAVDIVNDLKRGVLPDVEIVRSARAYYDKQRLLGKNVSFTEAVDAINALSYQEHIDSVLAFQEPI